MRHGVPATGVSVIRATCCGTSYPSAVPLRRAWSLCGLIACCTAAATYGATREAAGSSASVLQVCAATSNSVSHADLIVGYGTSIPSHQESSAAVVPAPLGMVLHSPNRTPCGDRWWQRIGIVGAFARRLEICKCRSTAVSRWLPSGGRRGSYPGQSEPSQGLFRGRENRDAHSRRALSRLVLTRGLDCRQAGTLQATLALRALLAGNT